MPRAAAGGARAVAAPADSEVGRLRAFVLRAGALSASIARRAIARLQLQGTIAAAHVASFLIARHQGLSPTRPPFPASASLPAAYSFSSLVVRHSSPLPPQAVAADTGACAGVRKREVFGALGGLLAGILLVLVVSGDVPLAHLLTPLGARPLPQLAVPHAIPVPPSPAGVLPAALRQYPRGHFAAVREPPCRRLLLSFPSRSARSSRRQPCATCRHCSAGAAAAGGAIAAAAAASSRCSCAVTCRCSAAAARARGTAAS